jgi:fermentation-respiration switch protein FrsA (DUF1100 family)
VSLLLIGALALLAVVAALWLFQRRLIYLPAGVAGPAPPGWSDETITTRDDLALGAWVHTPGPDAAVVVVFNGNAGNRSGRLGLGTALASAGLGVVLFDHRGYGGNGGTPSEEGLALDAAAVVAWVSRRHAGHRIVFLGESLGAAVAIRAAMESSPSAVVLRSPFASLGDVAAVHYPWLPVRQMLWDTYAVVDQIGEVAAPVSVVAGSGDRIVPMEQSRAVYEAASRPRRWVVVEGAGHNDARLAEGPAIVNAVLEVAGEGS